MALNLDKIKNVSAETKSAISRKSAQTLPNNPSERGYSAEEIKRRFYQPTLDAANSAIAEIDRVVNEANKTFSQVSDELDNFIDTTKITEAYKVTLDNSSWILNDETNMYELYISKEEHGIDDYKEIGVNMFLLDGNGKYTQVNQFEVGTDGTVRCFHETNGAGYISIYVKREGFIVGSSVVDADHVVGLAKVGRTNNFEDLDNKPNIDQMTTNEIMISKIISGVQTVNKATNADNATTATYAQTSGAATSADTALTANTAVSDQFGVNLHTGYAKQNGNYPNMTTGRSNNADNAKADEDGVNIKSNYAKQNGNYSNMSVGKATNADNATNATNAQKAVADANGANIANTYAKVSGTYPNLTAGQATKATSADSAASATNAINANIAVHDELGRKIISTYTTGRVLDRITVTVEVRVGDNDGGSDSVDLFRDTGTRFTMPVYVTSNTDGTDRRILFGLITRQVVVGSSRYDKDYLFLSIDEISPDCYPSHVRLTNEEYQYGVNPNAADKGAAVTINNKTFMRYNLFDEGHDFNNGNYVMFEILP